MMQGQSQRFSFRGINFPTWERLIRMNPDKNLLGISEPGSTGFSKALEGIFNPFKSFAAFTQGI
jgi:hypothetical protein